MLTKNNRLIGAILLVAGTTIGGGVLALPVITGIAGFFPSLLLMIAIWFFMMITALYLLEVNLRLPGEANLISMVHKTLGRPGEVISWISYLLLLYSLLAAYLLGCSQILSDFICPLIPKDVPTWIWPCVIFVFFGSIVYCGTQTVDLINRVWMIGLILGYVGLLSLGMSHVQLPLLTHQGWSHLAGATSVIVTSFGYHIIIPSLNTYLEHDSRLLKKAILIGSLIPLIFYVLWQLLALGVIPVEGEYSLTTAALKGLQATMYLQAIIGSPWICLSARFFAFFAIITSLLGVSLSLSDFLADGLKIKKNNKGKILIILLTFIPPLLFSLYFPQGFIRALKYAGIFVVILLILLPALMAWKERYSAKAKCSLISSHFRVPGGKWALAAVILLSFVLLGIEVCL